MAISFGKSDVGNRDASELDDSGALVASSGAAGRSQGRLWIVCSLASIGVQTDYIRCLVEYDQSPILLHKRGERGVARGTTIALSRPGARPCSTLVTVLGMGETRRRQKHCTELGTSVKPSRASRLAVG